MKTTSSYFILTRLDGPPDNQTETYFSGKTFMDSFDPMKVGKYTSLVEVARYYDSLAKEVQPNLRIRVLVEQTTTVIRPDLLRSATISIDYYIKNL